MNVHQLTPIVTVTVQKFLTVDNINLIHIMILKCASLSEIVRKTNFKLSNLNLSNPLKLWPTGDLPSENSILGHTHHVCTNKCQQAMYMHWH